ncbi:hypothetical protein ABIF65_008228 [Bradyrhizobium japonicum]
MMNSIALLNDSFRRTFSGGKVMMTIGVAELPDCVKAEALRQVRAINLPGRQPALPQLRQAQKQHCSR